MADHIVETPTLRASPSRPRRTRLVVVVAATVVLVVGLVLYVTLPRAVQAGPLQDAPGNGQASGTGVDAHTSATWGNTELRNTTHDLIVLDRVTVPTKTPGFVGRITAVNVERATGGVDGMIGDYPPAYLHNSRPVARTRILPGQEYSLTIQLTPPRNGKFWAGPVTVDYHIGSNRYRATIQSYGVICAPHTRAVTCDIPAGLP